MKTPAIHRRGKSKFSIKWYSGVQPRPITSIGRQYQGNTWTEEKLGHMMDWEDRNDDVDVKQKPRTCR